MVFIHNCLGLLNTTRWWFRWQKMAPDWLWDGLVHLNKKAFLANLQVGWNLLGESDVKTFYGFITNILPFRTTYNFQVILAQYMPFTKHPNESVWRRIARKLFGKAQIMNSPPWATSYQLVINFSPTSTFEEICAMHS